jgi:hypothetical protein
MKTLTIISATILLASCFSKTDQGKPKQSMIDSLLTYNKCVDEYHFSKLVLNSLMFDKNCVAKSCTDDHVDYDTTSAPLFDFTLELDTLRKGASCIEVFSDTLVFTFSLRSKENCLCYRDSETVPRRIMIKRGTENIYYLDYGSFMIRPESDFSEKHLTNPKMIEFIKLNKSSIDPWFYNELVKKGYLK